MNKKEPNSPDLPIFNNTQTNNVVSQDPIYETPTITEGQFEVPSFQTDVINSKHFNTERDDEYDEAEINDGEDEYIKENEADIFKAKMKYFGRNVTDKKSEDRFYSEYMDQVIDARIGRPRSPPQKNPKISTMKNSGHKSHAANK